MSHENRDDLATSRAALAIVLEAVARLDALNGIDDLGIKMSHPSDLRHDFGGWADNFRENITVLGGLRAAPVAVDTLDTAAALLGYPANSHRWWLLRYRLNTLAVSERPVAQDAIAAGNADYLRRFLVLPAEPMPAV